MFIARFAAAAVLALGTVQAFAADNIGEAVTDKAKDALIGAGEAWALNAGYNNFVYARPVLPKADLVLQSLDDGMINKIVDAADNTLFSTFGFKEFGGTKVVVTTDLKQVANVAGLRNINAALAARQVVGSEVAAAVRNFVTQVTPAAFKPKFGSTTISLRTTDLRTALNELKATGALVREVKVKSLIRGSAGKVLAVFNIALIGGAALDTWTAGNYALQSQFPESEAAWKYMNCTETSATPEQLEPTYTDCEMDANWVKQLIESTPLAIITVAMPD